MVQRMTIGLALLALLFQVGFVAGLSCYLEYKRVEVAIPMCVNQDRPELQCRGSCYISDQLAEAMQLTPSDQYPGATVSILWSFPVLFWEAPTAWHLLSPTKSARSATFRYTDWLPSFSPRDVFHPPRLA